MPLSRFLIELYFAKYLFNISLTDISKLNTNNFSSISLLNIIAIFSFFSSMISFSAVKWICLFLKIFSWIFEKKVVKILILFGWGLFSLLFFKERLSNIFWSNSLFSFSFSSYFPLNEDLLLQYFFNYLISIFGEFLLIFFLHN